MGLAASQFANNNANFTVTFNVTDGSLQITPVTDKVTVTITENGGKYTYDGTAKSANGYTVSISNPLYKESDFSFSGTAAVSGTNVGNYPMDVKASDFTNKNTNFTNVEFVVVDGELVIDPLAITVTITVTRTFRSTPALSSPFPAMRWRSATACTRKLTSPSPAPMLPRAPSWASIPWVLPLPSSPTTTPTSPSPSW